MCERLVEVLKRVGKSTEIYETPGGTRVLLLAYGARILGLFARGSDKNFYWTHPELEKVESARGLYESDNWHNSGGDRTWLAPEVDIFFPDYPNTRMHRPPRQLDAADYTVTRNGEGVRMEKRMSIRFARLKQEAQLRLAKSVAPAANPLRYERDLRDQSGSAEFAGYTQRTSLEFIGSESEAKVGLWNLIQMRHGGEILVPTYFRSSPRILFGNVAPHDLIAGDHLIRFRIRGPGEHKISIRAAATTGRAGYLYASGGQWALVIRNFFVNPSGEYVDVPKDDTEELGYAVQAVNVNSGLGSFCELEYHVPALEGNSAWSQCEDTSQVWAFRGSREIIQAVARRLLSSEV